MNDTPIDTCNAALSAALAIYERDRGRRKRTFKRRNATRVLLDTTRAAAIALGDARARAAAATHVRHIDDLQNAASDDARTIGRLNRELAQLRPRLANAEAVRDSLRDEVTELRAQAAGHVCEPLPQRHPVPAQEVAKVITEAAARTGRKTAPEPNGDPSAPPAKPRNAPASPPPGAQSGAEGATHTPGTPRGSKAAKSRTAPRSRPMEG